MAPAKSEEKRFAAAKTVLQRCLNDSRLDMPVKDWFNPADRRLFRGDALQPLRQIINLSFDDLCAKWGLDWMSLLVIVRTVERAAKQIKPVVHRSQLWTRFVSEPTTRPANSTREDVAPQAQNAIGHLQFAIPSGTSTAGSHPRDLSAELILAGARERLCPYLGSPTLELPLER
ncbi:MAG: hypothetical protein ACLQNE_40595 [Thermoguttaceae bacterium]